MLKLPELQRYSIAYILGLNITEISETVLILGRLYLCRQMDGIMTVLNNARLGVSRSNLILLWIDCVMLASLLQIDEGCSYCFEIKLTTTQLQVLCLLWLPQLIRTKPITLDFSEVFQHVWSCDQGRHVESKLLKSSMFEAGLKKVVPFRTTSREMTSVNPVIALYWRC